jgi:glycosyltransferase involved in cell wall biosynthesis
MKKLSSCLEIRFNSKNDHVSLKIYFEIFMTTDNSFADSFLQQITAFQNQFHDYEYPKVSIIIPTYNCAQDISITLDSIVSQNYPEFEIHIIDSGSQDRTREVVKRYRSDRIYVHYEPIGQRYHLLNQGIALSQGEYLNFLFPGDFYMSKDALKHVMSLALSQNKPQLVYSGTLLRDGKTDVKMLYRHLSIALLKKGQQPTSLQSCWFKNTVFSKLGLFNENLDLRGGFDLLCRFCGDPDLDFVSSSNVYIDYDLRWVTKNMIIRHFLETSKIVYKYYGLGCFLQWLMTQKDIKRYLKLWMHGVKLALTGR